MQNTGGRRRFSPSMVQSAVGLMILVTLGSLGGLVLWVTNFSFGGRSYKATFLFPNAGGMTEGTRVAYRGVAVGQVLNIEPETGGVAIEVEIWPADRLIPTNSRIEATQAGLVGETSIDITPLQPLPPEGVTAKPLDPDCEPTVIICNGSRLEGEGRLDVNALIRSLLQISNRLNDPEVTTSIRSVVQNINRATDSASDVFEQVRQSGSIKNLNSTLASLDQAADELSDLLASVRQREGLKTLDSTLVSLGEAADQINVFMAVNQDRVATTINSIGQTSDQLRVTVSKLDPAIEQIAQGELIPNLEAMSANAVDLTANLRDFSTNLNDPDTVVMLQQLLDSARSVFENINKITSDVDELTGNPEFRKDLEKLIQGLSNLVSSTQKLQQQVEYAQRLSEMAAEIAEVNPEGNTVQLRKFIGLDKQGELREQGEQRGQRGQEEQREQREQREHGEQGEQGERK